MKIVSEPREFHARGVQVKEEYEVVSNAKMMRMLSDSLYKDKVAAPIRELSTNASDAHKVVGCTKPFEVQLPSKTDPTFRIRDFGPSLSPDQVLEMYRKYGASDKGNTNDLQGCMGLGSKSPFAYCDQFTSVAIYDGIKYIWSNSKDARDIPSINLIHQEPTDEPTGFEVSFTVKKDDVQAFHDKARKVYRPFDVKPIVRGGPNGHAFSPAEFVFVLEADDGSWGLMSGHSEYYNKKDSCLIMGEIEYPIDPEHFKDKQQTVKGDSPSWYGRTIKKENKYVRLLSMGLVLKMDIGDVEMDISREGLQYHTLTVNAIKAVLDKVLDEISAKISKKFVACTSLWEARQLYYELTAGDLSQIEDLCGMVGIKYQGEKLTKNVEITGQFSIGMKKFHKNYNGNPKRTDNPVSVCCDSKPIGFYLNDVKSGGYAACIRDVQADKFDTIYLFKEDEDGGDTIDIVAKHIGLLDGDIVKVSDIPKPAKKKGKRKKSQHGAFKLVNTRGGWSRNPKSYWESVTVDFDSGGVYVEVNRFNPVRGIPYSVMHRVSNLYDMTAEMGGLGIIVPHVFGVKTISIKRFDKSDKWQTFEEWAKEEIEEYLKNNDLVKDVVDKESLSQLGFDGTILEVAGIANPNKVAGSEFYTFAAKVKKIKGKVDKQSNDATMARNVASKLKIDVPKPKSGGASLKAEEDAVMKKYGMLQIVDSWDIRHGGKKEALVNYINLVDSI